MFKSLLPGQIDSNQNLCFALILWLPSFVARYDQDLLNYTLHVNTYTRVCVSIQGSKSCRKQTNNTNMFERVWIWKLKNLYIISLASLEARKDVLPFSSTFKIFLGLGIWAIRKPRSQWTRSPPYSSLLELLNLSTLLNCWPKFDILYIFNKELVINIFFSKIRLVVGNFGYELYYD